MVQISNFNMIFVSMAKNLQSFELDASLSRKCFCGGLQGRIEHTQMTRESNIPRFFWKSRRKMPQN